MAKHAGKGEGAAGVTRRRFLADLGRSAVAGGVVAPLVGDAAAGAAAETTPGKVRRRTLGKTGLKVSEVGFGGHSWAYKRVPDGSGGYRRPTIDEATEMIRTGLEMGVNFFDSCTAHEESLVPGEALKRLKRRDDAIVSVRVSHKMKGVEADKQEIYDWTESRLKMWYWDMSYSMEALDKLKKQGKIRFTGFGCHFTPEWFREAFRKFGGYFDMCSLPYNVRHRAAEELLPEARKAGLGVVTIKPLARGALLKGRDLAGADTGLPRDMIAFVLENKHVDICTCGVHTLAQVRENVSASWTRLSPQGRKRLKTVATARLPGRDHAWLEDGWRYA